MSEQGVRKTLKAIGLTEKEGEVYTLLAKGGATRGLDVSKRLRMHKAQVYTILRNLQRKGIVEATLESPMRFSAIPFGEVLDSFIQTRRDEATSVEREKGLLLNDWERIKSGEPTSLVERFVTIQGRKRIQSKALDMLDETKKEIQMIVTATDTLRIDRLEFIEEILSKLTKHHSIRILTQVTKENLSTIRNLVKNASRKRIGARWRHLDIDSGSLPRIVMKDAEETLMLQTDDLLRGSREEIGLWTNSKLIADTSGRLFEELWDSGIDVAEKIYEIENRKPMGKTISIEDWRIAYKQFDERVRRARKEIVQIAPSIDVLNHQGKYSVQDIHDRGVKIRAMLPVEVDNLEQARSLSRYCEIRDPNVNYLGMALIDGEHLFQFSAQIHDAKDIDPSIYFKNMFYTTEPMHIRRISEMLEGLWQRSSNIPDIELRLKRKR